jgi:hypothetical protein
MIAATGKHTLVTEEARQLIELPVAEAVLERECCSYARYLAGQPPSRYIIEKYQDFHQKIGLSAVHRYDRFLIAVSARGPFWARLVDSYVSFWRKGSVVRNKIVLTLALLECAPPTFEAMDRVPAGGWIGALLRLAGGAVSYGVTLIAATVLFTPVSLWMAGRER